MNSLRSVSARTDNSGVMTVATPYVASAKLIVILLYVNV